MKRFVWSVLAVGLLFLGLGLAVPRLAVATFGSRVKDALEASLGRHVKLRGVTFDLFTGPGFTISEVEISDDPALSPEPILYAGTLTAIPRIWPLFAGRLAFSSIRLTDAHINLGRNAAPDQPARWNVEPLIRPALFKAFPYISVESGGVTGMIPKSRLNFKIGGVKTVFYLLIDKLEVRPPTTSNGPWAIRLEGEPARSDRPALGFGSFVVDGRWIPAQGLADITVRLERSEIGDMIALLNGHDAGVHGSVSGTLRIAGPLAALKINGRVDVSGIHGWDQLASSAQNWPLAVAGTWNLPGQLFELDARLAGQPNAPVNARFRVADYLGAPHWGISLTCHAMPLQPLLPLARQVGVPIPGGVQLNGTLDGAVSISRTGPYEGSGWASKVSLAASGAPPVLFEDVRVMIADGHARLAPSALRTVPGDEATLQGDYDLENHTLKVTVVSHGMDIATLHRHAELAGIPALRDLQAGTWRGQVSYLLDPAAESSPENTGVSRWTGTLDIQRATMALPMFALPVRIIAAHAELDGPSITVRKIQARSGDLAVTGEYRYEPAALRPHRFHLTSAHVNGTQLETLFRPALYRGGLVSRALGLRSSEVPVWLARLRADGTLDIGTLNFAGSELERFSTRVVWDGARIKLAGTKARYGGGSVSGAIDMDLTGYAPSYHFAGDVAGVEWKGGRVNSDLTADTSGAGTDMLGNLRAEGSFDARGLDLDYASMTGCFQFAWARNAPQFKLTSLKLSDGDETLIGSGSTAPNGELVLDMAGVAKPVRLTLR
jgi:hypothetical protein